MIETDVIVVGAGPTGLMLGYELDLAGASCVVLDRLAEPSEQSKAGAIQPRTAEMLDLRGLLDPLLAAYPDATDVLPRGHFGALPVQLDCTPLQSRYPGPLRLWQRHIQAMLAARLGDGLVHRDAEVTAISQDDDSVTVRTTRGDYTGRFLVACDGAHSAIRSKLRVAFPGEPPTMSASVADIVLADNTGAPQRGHISTLMRHGNGYWTMLNPVEGNRYSLIFGSVNADPLARDTKVTEKEVRTALHAVHGDDVVLSEVLAGSRFRDATRQVEQYRHGRVFFAGDAAHIHLPAGGQGLNLGMQDAMNLGWKLAAHLHGRLPEEILDTYHDERHPVGATVLHNTLAQRALMTPQLTAQTRALRDIVIELISLPEGNRFISGMMSGLSIEYPMTGPAHPLLGRRMPDLDLVTHGEARRLSDLLHEGRGALIEFGETTQFAANDRVPHHTVKCASDPGALAVLLRPDGYVAWAATDRDTPGLPDALRRWFGS